MLDWITTTINSLGYLGIGFLMFMENLFPPIPSELIMPLAGFVVAQGKMNFIYVLLAGVIGTILGAFPWYYAGHLLGEERLSRLCDRYGKWIGISGADIARSKSWFDRHGGKAVLLCRLVPGVRTLISIPAGISNMNMASFLIYSTIGTTLWVGLLIYAGFALGQNYQIVNDLLDPVPKYVLISIAIVFVIFLIVKNLRAKKTEN